MPKISNRRFLQSQIEATVGDIKKNIADTLRKRPRDKESLTLAIKEAISRWEGEIEGAQGTQASQPVASGANLVLPSAASQANPDSAMGNTTIDQGDVTHQSTDLEHTHSQMNQANLNSKTANPSPGHGNVISNSYLSEHERSQMAPDIIDNMGQIIVRATVRLPIQQRDPRRLAKVICVIARLHGPSGKDALSSFVNELSGHSRHHFTPMTFESETLRNMDERNLVEAAIRTNNRLRADRVSARLDHYQEKLHRVDLSKCVDQLEKEFQNPTSTIRSTLKHHGFRNWNNSNKSPIVDYVLWHTANIHPTTADPTGDHQKKKKFEEELHIGRVLALIKEYIGAGSFIMMTDDVYVRLKNLKLADVEVALKSIVEHIPYAKEFGPHVEREVMKPMLSGDVDGASIKFVFP